MNGKLRNSEVCYMISITTGGETIHECVKQFAEHIQFESVLKIIKNEVLNLFKDDYPLEYEKISEHTISVMYTIAGNPYFGIITMFDEHQDELLTIGVGYADININGAEDNAPETLLDPCEEEHSTH